MFELKLANGKSIKTNSGFELAMFYASDGNSKLPIKQGKKGRRKKSKK